MLIITKKVKKIFKICSLVFIFLFLSVIILSGVEKNIMPKITEISGLKVKSFADNAIDAAVKESIEEMMGNVHVNAIHEETTKGGTLSDIRSYEPGSVLNNWMAEEIPVVFRAYTE